MKKIILGSFAISCFVANAADSDVNYYCGLGLNSTFTTSEYEMNFTVNRGNAGNESGGSVKNKFNNRKKIGYNVFLGISAGESCYCAIELGANLSRLKLIRDFTDYEAKELGGIALNHNGSLHTNLKCKYDNEYNLAFKFGKRMSTKSFGEVDLYGILGLSTRNLDVDYSYYIGNFPAFEGMYCQYRHMFSKKLWAFTPGIGAEFRIRDNCSIGLEYKHKFYPSVTSHKDLRNAPLDVALLRGDFDTSIRSYKVKSSQNDLSLRLIFNI